MLIVHGIDDIPREARGAALAIGNFDGVHRGHQALLDIARKEARKVDRPAGVILFEPHPREFFQPDRPHFRLTPLPLKLELLKSFGLDLAVVLAFDAGLAALPAETFISRVLAEALAARHVVVGYDFRFGKGRGGDPETLRRAGAAYGFGVTVVPQVAEAGEVFSSGAIRAELGQATCRAPRRCWAGGGASSARCAAGRSAAPAWAIRPPTSA
jgi:riboflavin kinase/FMN adenylyltransferase